MLFTGHMIDAPGRPKARFPPTPQAEEAACRMIRDALAREIGAGGTVLGIAGGACGGDILFHEACEAAGIPSRLLLALPEEKFLQTSVQHGGPGWVERYRRLCRRLPLRVLQSWEDDQVWQRSNLWMMDSALATGARERMLLALYNPELDPDGPGGTAQLVREAEARGFRTVALDARALLT